MVHVLASFAFMLVALGTFAVIAFMLVAEQTKIAAALGRRTMSTARPVVRAVRVRMTGRWQAAPPLVERPQRAAA